MTLTDDQRELLEDKFLLWDRASREGSMELRDYNRRATDAIKAALSICADTPLPHPEGQSALVDAARAMADDYQTSPNHHPQHVLVPLAAFEAMRAALAQPDPLTETSGRVDGSSVAASAGAGPDGPGACDAQCQSEGEA